ncbi:hypothetical protein F7725_024286 [Dissostichus mawsoni]|uniref:Phosphatidic acid phosphatase type 2/haloperoxidase domain-containing protein n=1 Tax=Dissostichus mawsoni TaxID=36200 RepID=A0A7J5XYW7_DISMA|nr:hypothetical protein F7725_024286 [Dissostichus mawsoni]
MNVSPPDRRKNVRELALEIGIRVLLFGVFVFTEFLEPFERVIQPEELWLYKNPLVESDHIPKRVMFVSYFISCPLAVIFVVKIIQRTDRTELKEACFGIIFIKDTQTIFWVLFSFRPRPDYFHRCFPDGQINAKMLCTGEPDIVSEGRKSFPSSHSSFAFSGLGFTSFYLAGKLQCFTDKGRGRSWRLCAMVLPLYSAMMIALSRTCDYKHHWQDAVVGGVIGLLFAYICYRQHTHPFCTRTATCLTPVWLLLPTCPRTPRTTRSPRTMPPAFPWRA